MIVVETTCTDNMHDIDASEALDSDTDILERCSRILAYVSFKVAASVLHAEDVDTGGSGSPSVETVDKAIKC